MLPSKTVLMFLRNAIDKIETRSMVLGHIQRSGTPSSFDHLLAATFAKKAVDLIAEENYNQLVVWQNGEVESQPLEQVIAYIKKRHQLSICPNPVNPDGFLVETARSLGIYMGDVVKIHRDRSIISG